MARALDSAIGLPNRPTSASWMLAFLIPAEVSRSFTRAAFSAGAREGRPPVRPIGLDHHAGRQRARLDQLQVVRLAVLREEPQPVADDDRRDPQVQLVDQVPLEEPPEQLAAAMKLELTAGLRLQLANRRLNVAVD